jgi:hypothetical protein
MLHSWGSRIEITSAPRTERGAGDRPVSICRPPDFQKPTDESPFRGVFLMSRPSKRWGAHVDGISLVSRCASEAAAYSSPLAASRRSAYEGPNSACDCIARVRG